MERNWYCKLVILGLFVFVATSVGATVHNINISNFSFSPPGTIVMYGDTVRWTWGSGTHSTTSDVGSPKLWDSGVKSTGTYDLVFTAGDGPGPFPYHCTPHFTTMFDTIWIASITCYNDAYGDGYGDVTDAGSPGTGGCPPGMVDNNLDCNDGNNSINPGATDIPDNSIDEDCNGIDATTCFIDADQDGFGGTSTGVNPNGNCTDPGFSNTSDDCDDSDPNIYPGAPEIPDNFIDEDCDGVDARMCYPDFDGDGYGDGNAGIVELSGICAGGWTPNGSDCDDSDANVHPQTADIPDNGIDDDCDGFDATICYDDSDGDSFGDPGSDILEATGVCSGGRVTNDLDCHALEPTIYPGAPEVPDDGIDQDCDGVDATQCYADLDGDSFGDPASPIIDLSGTCTGGTVADNTDCDDANPSQPPCGCCVGTRGDVNGDGADLDIVDLTCVVDFLFGTGCAMPCAEEADVNGDGASADIVDLTFVVDWLFGVAPTPVSCL